jgi:DNA-binding IscR family transcriptional regulator
MLRLNKKIEYALLALLDLEEHGHTKEARTVKQIVANSHRPRALAGKSNRPLNNSAV